MTAERMTIADIARAAGVSPATVSRVLNQNPTVAPDLVRRVEATIEELNYRPNGAGRALRRQRSDLWAAIVPDVRNPFFYRLIESFEKVAHVQGLSVVLCNSAEDLVLERSAIETVIAHQVSGALIAAVSASQSRINQFERAGIPVVSVDRRINGFSGDMVQVDNERIGRLAATHLLEQGRTNPVVLSHAGDLTPMLERERGFLQSLAESGHPVAPDRVAHLPFHAPGSLELVEGFFTSVADADAVFATTNTLTSEAFAVLRASGRAIGPEVGLVGVDDDQWNIMVEPAVTVIEQPAEQLGRWAAQMLIARAGGREIDHARVLLDPVLRVRASTLRNPA